MSNEKKVPQQNPLDTTTPLDMVRAKNEKEKKQSN
jgi:hypothetical protein